MRLLGPGDFQRMPWKNGLGVTVQIAIAPPGASVENFDWRVSTAGVAASGPFSAFADIDRSLVVLRGGPMRLVMRAPDATHEAVLDADSAPCRFGGDWPTQAELLGSDEVVDFNVMTRRGRFDHRLLRLDIDAPTPVAGALVLVYCVRGELSCRDMLAAAARPATLVAGAALLVQANAGDRGGVRLQLDPGATGPARILVVHLLANGASS